MMIAYTGLSKLKTKPVVYQNVLLASDPDTLEQLKELSSRRKAIEDSINESRFVTEAIAREMSGGLTSRFEQDIQKLERYLPLLENLVHQINLNRSNRQVICWISDLRIRWSSVLAPISIFHLQGPKFYQINDILFELAMTLFLYGALLHERAVEVLSSDLVQSATLFRKAAGVFTYLAREVLSLRYWTQERPPEVRPIVSSILSLICLAEAQAVTARKAEENGNTGGLLAKLHWGVREFLVEAIYILRVTMDEGMNISSHLLDFAISRKTLHELMSYKYLVQGLKDDGKIGIAIGVLRLALTNAKKNVPKEESWRLVHKQVMDELSVLLQKYEHENECVWYEKVPDDEDELPLPQAVSIVKLIPYQPQKWKRTLVFKL